MISKYRFRPSFPTTSGFVSDFLLLPSTFTVNQTINFPFYLTYPFLFTFCFFRSPVVLKNEISTAKGFIWRLNFPIRSVKTFLTQKRKANATEKLPIKEFYESSLWLTQINTSQANKWRKLNESRNLFDSYTYKPGWSGQKRRRTRWEMDSRKRAFEATRRISERRKWRSCVTGEWNLEH